MPRESAPEMATAESLVEELSEDEPGGELESKKSVSAMPILNRWNGVTLLSAPYLSSTCWLGSGGLSLLVWVLDPCCPASPAAVTGLVPVCSTVLVPPPSPTPSSRLQEARLLVSIGEPSSWLLTAVKASESSALSGESEAGRITKEEIYFQQEVY